MSQPQTDESAPPPPPHAYDVQVSRDDEMNGCDEDDDEDDRVSDWASDLGEALRTFSLFDTDLKPFARPEEALEYDKRVHGFDLSAERERLKLDLYGKMRLINLIRRDRLSPEAVRQLGPSAPILQDDALLVPVIQDDPLLQFDFDDWSDDEEDAKPSGKAPVKHVAPGTLSNELQAAQEKISALRELLDRAMSDEADGVSGPSGSKPMGKKVEGEDHSEYFDSYAKNEIHEEMLKDTARTVSYGRFIMSNPAIFKDAIVMDVGCGTAILSMLAARAGAKHVYAIEASKMAVTARENIQKNGLSDVITVVHGLVEKITLPVDKVDIIISEWMGYMLLYESMLDSVLRARDKFLRAGGLMAPSQTRLVICAVTGERLWKEKIAFWESVYGFDMSAMTAPYYDEGMVAGIEASEVVTDEFILKDINTYTATPESLDFSSSFTLTSTSKETRTIRAFSTHFDTFFSPFSEQPNSHIPLSEPVSISEFPKTLVNREITSVSEKKTHNGVQISFTTGPAGQRTHWEQVVFFLKSPITLNVGESINGQFVCRKASHYSRAIDVELHWSVGESGVSSSQMFKIR